MINLTNSESKIREGDNNTADAKPDRHTTELVPHLEKKFVVEGTNYEDYSNDCYVQKTV
jgi:hypothetical protein